MRHFTLRRNRRERDPLEHYYEIVLLDTADLNDRGRPKQKAVIGMLLNQPRRSIGYGATAQLDDAIVTILTPDARRDHLGGALFIDYASCCSRCGGALDIERCVGCGRGFRYDGISALDGIAVPSKVRAWLAARGYTFERRH